MTDPDAVRELTTHAVFETYYFNPRRPETLAELDANEAAYRESAGRFLAALGETDWTTTTPMQAWVARRPETPTADAFRPASGYWGNAVWRPPTGGFWTSTLVQGTTPWKELLKPHVASVWSFEAEPTSVLHIRTAEDWQRLVAQYPRRIAEPPHPIGGSVVDLPAAPLYLPDWEQVAADWAGIHFTVEGKLRSLFVLSPIEDGFTVILGEEALEETLWLRWPLSEAKRIV